MMTEQEISILSMHIINDSKFWIALIGVIGAIVGSIIAIFGKFIIELWKSKDKRKLDKLRQNMLKNMLSDESFKWRNLSTLSAVIGCNEEETKSHLIIINARGSEKK